MMKKLTLATAAFLAATAATAQETPLWVRGTAISPDGNTIAFTYKGDIYTVPATGGRATRITVSPAVDANPFFSPDGRRLVFNSNREGSHDIYVVAATGGTPVRLTTHSGAESARGWLNDSTVIFSADIMPSVSDLNGSFFNQTYCVADTAGSRPRMLQSLAMQSLDVNPAGDIVFQNRKSFENLFRKHEVSSGTPDVYLLRDGEFTRLTTGEGSFRNPVWLGADGTRYAYTAEGDSAGALNVYAATVGVPGSTRLTAFEEHPVRYLSASADGKRLAFCHDGAVYTLTPGEEPRKVDIEVVADNYDGDHLRSIVTGGADNMAVAPSGEEVAFTYRGDIYVTSVEYPTTRRITDTPGQERCMDFSADGRSLVYDSERNGRWQLFVSRLANDDDKSFTYAADIVEEPLYSSDKAAQQPEFSPDGTRVAFLEDRTTLRIIDVDTKEVTTVLPGRFNYSYADGDISFQWSPDGNWLLIDYIGVGGWNNKDIALVAADGSEVIDLTESGYEDGEPRWAMDGKAVTYSTGRYGYRSHGSWGNEDDIVLMALDGEAWEKFNMTKEEAERAQADSDDSDDNESDDDDSATRKKKKKKQPRVQPTAASAFDLGNRRHRIARLTGRSSKLVDYYLSPKGDKLYYLAAAPEGSYKLYVRDLRDDETSVLSTEVRGGFIADRKGENLFILSGSGMKKLELASGDVKPIEFEALYDRHPSLERAYIYDHAWQQVKDKFYDADIHGIDWDGFGEHYRRFLPAITNSADFAELLSELLGELNASHTGASAYSFDSPSLETATLGAWFDPDYEGDGLRIERILPRGPLSAAKARLAPGDIILAVDGRRIEAGRDYFPLLDGKAGRPTRLTVRRNGDPADSVVTVKPIESDTRLQYQAWVERNEQLVDSLSGGRIGYIHIEGMDSPSFRTAYDRLLGRYRNCDAVIVDTRFNGGGWLHNDVAILLGGKEYVRYAPRGQYIGSDPFNQWFKPSVMLVNEANYSDAHGTPYVYQTLGIGDLVGAPVPGTMTAVWWEQQIDPSLVFGIPEVTSLNREGKPLENTQLQPEVEVYNTPAETTVGNDVQIATAVRHLLEKLGAAAQ